MLNYTEGMNQSDKILYAAFKCISSKGYANISMRDISEEAGVILSQINYYYKNKEGLFIEVVKALANQYLSEIENVLVSCSTAKQRMEELIGYFQEMLRTTPETIKILFDLTSMSLWSVSLRTLLNDLYAKISFLIDKYIVSDMTIRHEYKGITSIALSRMISGTIFGTAIQIVISEDREDLINSLSIVGQLLIN